MNSYIKQIRIPLTGLNLPHFSACEFILSTNMKINKKSRILKSTKKMKTKCFSQLLFNVTIKQWPQVSLSVIDKDKWSIWLLTQLKKKHLNSSTNHLNNIKIKKIKNIRQIHFFTLWNFFEPIFLDEGW